jgi:hypothetical protein
LILAIPLSEIKPEKKEKKDGLIVPSLREDFEIAGYRRGFFTEMGDDRSLC